MSDTIPWLDNSSIDTIAESITHAQEVIRAHLHHVLITPRFFTLSGEDKILKERLVRKVTQRKNANLTIIPESTFLEIKPTECAALLEEIYSGATEKTVVYFQDADTYFFDRIGYPPFQFQIINNYFRNLFDFLGPEERNKDCPTTFFDVKKHALNGLGVRIPKSENYTTQNI